MKGFKPVETERTKKACAEFTEYIKAHGGKIPTDDTAKTYKSFKEFQKDMDSDLTQEQIEEARAYGKKYDIGFPEDAPRDQQVRLENWHKKDSPV